MSRPTRTFVVVVDENDLFREGLRRILSDTAFRVTRDTASLEGFLHGLPAKAAPQLLLLSAGTDHLATVSQIQRFKAAYPDARVVVLSDECNFDSVVAMLRAGANGFVLKRIDFRAFAKSLEMVMLGQSVLSSSVVEIFRQQRLEPPGGLYTSPVPRQQALAERDSQKFSTRQMEILDCLTRGEANKLIARKFAIAEATVKVHVKAILRKIHAKNRTQAAIWARDYLPGSGNSTIETTIASEDETNPGPPSDPEPQDGLVRLDP
jgi:two-component system nitrate/nitrite response regulator NarL